jgi:hypothetical protein
MCVCVVATDPESKCFRGVGINFGLLTFSFDSVIRLLLEFDVDEARFRH